MTRVRPTHFLSLPFGVHHPELRARAHEALACMRDGDELPQGVDNSIFIAPIRLHLTLGVMRLIESPPSTRHGRQQAALPTIAQAVELLQSCQNQVQEALAGQPLKVHFKGLHSFQQHPDKCHVLYGVPADPSHEDGRIKAVCDIVYHRFREGGYILDNARDYTLHLTLMNSSHRKAPRGVKLSKKRIAFDASKLLGPDAEPNNVDLGMYMAPELCIARMGSHAENGAYVTFGGIPLVPPLVEREDSDLAGSSEEQPYGRQKENMLKDS